MATDPLVPTKTPFNFNLGINYATEVYGRTGRSITADLDQITQYFGQIRTYQDVQDPTSPSNPAINLNEQQVINYIVDPTHAPNLQVAMGTWTSAVASGGFGGPWNPGFMTDLNYTNAWVQMIIGAFGSVQAVKDHLPMILLGNEIDQTGNFPSTNATTTQTYIGWVEQSFDNLKTSLANAGLGSIPVSTTIAAYNRADLGDMVSKQVTQYIFQNWSSSWNGGQPVVLFNSYTGNDGRGFASSTDFSTVIAYYNSLQQTFSGTGPHVQPFAGETGYSTIYGQADQNLVYQQIANWLNGQYANNGHRTIPLFPFDAFDLPQPPGGQPVETGFGIFSQNGSFQPTGLKSGLALPVWSRNQILAPTALMSAQGHDGLMMQNGQQLAYWQISGTTVVANGNIGQALGSGWSAAGSGTFEAGGKGDLLLQNGQQLAEWQMSGQSVIGGGNIGTLGAGWSLKGVADFNKDGLSDLLLQNGQLLAEWHMNGTSVIGGGNIGSLGAGWAVAGIGDFNKDGRDDLLLQNGQQLAAWLMNGTSVIGGGTIDTLAAGWSVGGVGDFNRDGFADLLLQSGQLLAEWQMNGTSVIGGGNIGTLGAGWSVSGVGDFSHHGSSDLLLQSGQQFAEWQLNGTSVVGGGDIGTLGTPWTSVTGSHLG